MLIYAGVLKQGFSRAERGGLGTMLPAARELNSEVLKHKEHVSPVPSSPLEDGPDLVSSGL